MTTATAPATRVILSRGPAEYLEVTYDDRGQLARLTQGRAPSSDQVTISRAEAARLVAALEGAGMITFGARHYFDHVLISPAGIGHLAGCGHLTDSGDFALWAEYDGARAWERLCGGEELTATGRRYSNVMTARRACSTCVAQAPWF